MIFPDIKLENWLDKYTELEEVRKECNNCKKTMKANKPFLIKGYAGITSEKCSCGKNRSECSSMVTNSIEEHLKWKNLLG